VPVTISAQAPFVIIVSPMAKIQTLGQLLAQAKANPGKITYGSAGIGSVNHIVTELFKREAKVDLLHVPYKGMGDAMTGLLTGTVDLIITAMPTAIPHIKSGKAVALAVTSAQRSPALPNVPTVREAGVPTYVAGNWFGLTAPKGTPPEAIAVTLLGARMDAPRIVASLERASGPASVFGMGRRTDVCAAALINGTSSHADLFDDNNAPMIAHPSGPLVSALLPLAPIRGASG